MEEYNKKNLAVESINSMPPIVCAYACIPDTDGTAPFGQANWTSTPPAQKADLDIEAVQKIVNEISDLSKQAGKLDALLVNSSSSRLYLCTSKDGQVLKEGLSFPGDSEIAGSILELVRGHFELEIEKRKEELRKLLQ